MLPALRVPSRARAEALRHVGYVSKGTVLNAHERRAPGAFRLDDLLSDDAEATHPKPYVGSEDLRPSETGDGVCPLDDEA